MTGWTYRLCVGCSFVLLSVMAIGRSSAQVVSHVPIIEPDEKSIVDGLDLADPMDSGSPRSTLTAAINRALMQISVEEQYQLLSEWSLPDTGAARSLTEICNVQSPPNEFAREIGERPRDSVFAKPRTASVDGLFSTAWLLATTAKEAGRTRVLKERIADREDVEHIDLMVAIVDGRDAEQIKQGVSNLVDALEKEPVNLMRAISIAAACAENEQTKSHMHEICEAVSALKPSRVILTSIGRIQTTEAFRKSAAAMEISDDWIKLDSQTPWYLHNDHFTCSELPAGIMYRYPIGGDFRFRYEQLGTKPNDDSTVGYDGQNVEFLGHWRDGTNQRAIESRDGKVRFFSNGHPVATGSKKTSSPWLAIGSGSRSSGRFRNLRLTGSPLIPRQVNLIGDTNAKGWKTYRGPEVYGMTDAFNADAWPVTNGVLQSRTEPETQERLLRYIRPLQENETFEYEFLASADSMVHPTLGRLAFLVLPSGVKLHWVTDGTDEWTGLTTQNAIVEPLARRGPRPLPLMNGEWNRISMTLQDAKISLQLNGTEIYRRDVQPDDDTRFGLFHDPSKTSVKVRNATLTGDWPAEANLDAPIEFAETVTAELSEQAKKLFPRADLRQNLTSVLRHASTLSAASRYDFLVDWVIPNQWHDEYRVNGYFRPIHIAPQRRLHADDVGGQLVAPAIELVRVAKELGRLPELLKTVKNALKVESDPEQEDDAIKKRDRSAERAVAALSALIHHAAGDSASVVSDVKMLSDLVEVSSEILPEQHWPEMLVAHQLAEHSASSQQRRTLISHTQAWKFAGNAVIGSELVRQLNRLRINDHEFGTKPKVNLTNWIATSRYHAMKSNEGRGEAKWEAVQGEVRSAGGYGDDLLIYESPLQGDYEVQFETSSLSYFNASAYVAGERTEIRPWQSTVTVGSHDRGFKQIKVEPRMPTDGDWWHQRHVVRDGVCTTFVNGQRLSSSRRVAGFPWLAIVHSSGNGGGVRDFKISGNPTIPDELLLSTDGLAGWRPYMTYSMAWENNLWTIKDGVMAGKRGIAPPGSIDESLLYYQRPMAEDGSIKYQYFYSPGHQNVFPALGRTALIIQPKGVAEHHVSNGYFDATYLDKANQSWASAHQRSKPADALREDAWNDVEVSVRGDQMELKLNDHLIYVRPIPKQNTRLFGLFYFADQVSAAVKNVVLRSDWSKKLPPLDQQVLADPTVLMLDRTREELTAKFEHDFAAKGLPDGSSAFKPNDNGRMKLTKSGVQVEVVDASKWSQAVINCGKQIMGDFDVTADFEGFEVAGSMGGSILMNIPITTADNFNVRIVRNHQSVKKNNIGAQIQVDKQSNVRPPKIKPMAWNANSGTLRIARRGTKVYMLAKNADTNVFRLIGSGEASNAQVPRIYLSTVAQSTKRTSVTWRNIKIRAHSISGPKKSNSNRDRRILVMDPDGKNLIQLTKEVSGQTGHGSPEFSPDGKLIAFDIFNGSGSKSRLFLAASDGSGVPVDIGNGSMPTFTPDGKRIVCSAGDGMVIMDIDGRNREVISQSGWGVQLAPDGQNVAFYENAASGPNWTVVNLETKAKSLLLSGATARRYRQLFWNPDWSADSSKFAFWGTNRQTGQRELAIVSAKGSQDGFQVLRSGEEYGNGIAWHPDGNRLVVSKMSPAFGYQLQFVIKVDDLDFEEPFGGIHHSQSISDGEWSRDGKRIAFGGVPPETVPADPEKLLAALRTQLTGDLPKHALEFDGLFNYVTVPSIMYDGSYPVTLEAYVTHDRFGSVVVGDTQQAGLALGVPSKKYNMHAWIGNGYKSATSSVLPSVNERVHVAGTFDGKSLALFVNGKLSKSVFLSGQFKPSGLPITIGASPSPGPPGIDFAFDGIIDGVRVSRGRRYTKDFEPPGKLGSDDSTLAVYRFDEGEGLRLGDDSGNGHHGEIRGAKWVTGDAIRLRAARGLVDLGDMAAKTFADALKHENALVRRLAAESLGQLGAASELALAELSRAAKDSDKGVRDAARQAIEIITEAH